MKNAVIAPNDTRPDTALPPKRHGSLRLKPLAVPRDRGSLRLAHQHILRRMSGSVGFPRLE